MFFLISEICLFLFLLLLISVICRLKERSNAEEQTDYGLGRVKLTIRYRKNTLVVLVICAE